MVAKNPYSKYNNNKVLTASPRELTLMLYDGAIKFVNIAVLSIERKEIEKAHTNIKKAERIIDEFRITLDMTYPVSEDFERIYVYLSKRLVEANLMKNIEILEEVLSHLRSLRDTWKEAMRLANQC